MSKKSEVSGEWYEEYMLRDFPLFLERATFDKIENYIGAVKLHNEALADKLLNRWRTHIIKLWDENDIDTSDDEE